MLLTVDNNRNNKRVHQSGSRLCPIRVVWCDRPYDPTQLNWTKLSKCSESIKLIKTSRVEMSRIVRVITPNDATRPNSLVESDLLVWSRLRCDSTKRFCWVESERMVWSRLRSDSTKQFSWDESDRLVWSHLNAVRRFYIIGLQHLFDLFISICQVVWWVLS